MVNINLDINNFGIINDANIKLKKLNIIAGENGSGKSSISKLLSCFLTANSNEGYYLANKSIYDRFVSLIFKWDRKLSNLLNEYKSLSFRINVFENEKNLQKESFNQLMFLQVDKLKKIIDDYDFSEKNIFLKELHKIEILLDINEQDRYFNVSASLLNSEFNFDELMIYNAKVQFYGDFDNCKFCHEIDFNQNKIGTKIIEGYVNCLNFDNVIYIDSSVIFDYEESLRIYKNSSNHIDILSRQLNILKNTNDVYEDFDCEKIYYFKSKLKKLLNGQIYFDSKKDKFLFKKENKTFSMNNTANGIKQFGLIQILLENGVLKENTFLIIDGVEVNLHPEWQIRFAELLVMMVNELNIYIYINSHSPPFIEALEVFSAKYGIDKQCKFYLSKSLDNGKYSFHEIERNDLHIIYDNLGNPYAEIDKIRIENAFNGIM